MEESKITIIVQQGVNHCQIDDFPQGCSRSCVGSLRIAPGTMQITDDELKHLRKHHKTISRRLVLIPANGSKSVEKIELPIKNKKSKKKTWIGQK